MRRNLWAAAFVLALFASVAPAAADTIVLDFGTGTAGAGGTITSAGGVVTGTGILIDTLLFLPPNIPYDVDGSGVGFGGEATGVLNFGFGGSTNYIEIIGSIPQLGIDDPITLLSGTFFAFSYIQGFGVAASGWDTKNPILLTALGLNPSMAFEYYGFSITERDTPTAISTDIRNTSVPDAGSSLLLLGMGLVGLRMWRRR